ncbi:MAG: ABC transporter substrate-binding protein [Phototrophicaceae bacterium]
MRKLFLTTFTLALLGLLALTPVLAQQDQLVCPEGNPELVIAAGSVGNELELLNTSLARYMSVCPNVTASALVTPDLATDRLGFYNQSLGARSDAVDIYMIDVIWPGIVAEHMVNIYDYLAPDSVWITQHEPSLIVNNTVDGRLVAMPWYVDTGLLYYRQDLLDKYGLTVPATWDELTTSAQTIQDGERAEGHPDFYGYVFQAKLGEATTVNSLEWQASEGGGVIVTPDGEIQVNSPETLRAIERAAGWIGTIAPAEVIDYGVEDARRIWQGGNAAFMRNWSYAYALGNADDSVIKGLFSIAPLPAGANGVAATAGGWSLAISQYSRDPQAALTLVQYLTSAEEQRFRAVGDETISGGFNPTILSVYEDPQVLAASPQFEQIFNTLASGGATARPSTVAGARYNELSLLYAEAIHSVLRGEESARIALDDLEFDLEDLVIDLGF